MFFSKVMLAALAGVSAVVAVPFAKRDAATIEKNLATVASDVTALDTQIKAFTGDILSALSFLTAYNNLDAAIKTTTTSVTSSAAISAADSAVIASSGNTLTANVQTSINDLILKASTVATAGYSSVVDSSLQTLKTDTDALFTALKAKLDASVTASLTTNQAAIDLALNNAIAIF